MTRRKIIAGGVVAALVLGAGGGYVLLRGGSTPLPLEETVRRYRSNTPVATPKPAARSRQPALQAADPATATTPPSDVGRVRARGVEGRRPLPREGVYVYATTGSDEVDALNGSRHRYPDETTITVRHEGCGLIERWDALKERWDERESCRTPRGDTLRRVTSYHQFFHHGDERTLRCDGFTYPAGARPGDTWSMRCDNDTTKSVSTLRAIGYENVVVAGKPVQTLHVRVDTKLSGEQKGEGHRDVWGARESGLVLRERSSLRSESVQPALGRVTYSERYELRLKSLEPRT